MAVAGLLMLLVGCVLSLGSRTSGGRTPVDVGRRRVDITPDYPIRLSGYLGRTSTNRRASRSGSGPRRWRSARTSRGRPCSSPSTTWASRDAIVEEVAARLKRKASLDRERLAVGSSHTHSAPCLTGVAPNIFGKPIPADEQAAIDRYTRELDRQARAGRASTPSRTAGPGGSPGRRARSASPTNRRTPGGPVDHSLPVLRRSTDPDGTLRAVVVNYACHCTTLDPKENTVSGDWAGYAQAAIEADHPGCVALTVIGCGADANPTRRLDPGAAAAHGRAIADEVEPPAARALDRRSPRRPRSAFERFTLPFDTLPTRERAARRWSRPAARPATTPRSSSRSSIAASRSRAELDYSVQAWRFGDELAMVFLPGEVVVDYVLRLKKEFDPARLWVTAYANDVPCYIPSERILREGGYEGGGAMVYYAPADPAQARASSRSSSTPSTGSSPDGFKHGRPEARPTTRCRRRSRPARPCARSGSSRACGSSWSPPSRWSRAPSPSTSAPTASSGSARCATIPTGIDGNWKPGGVIKVLEDRDGDGRYDTATELPRRPPVPDRRDGLAQGRPHLRSARDPLRRGHRRRRQGRRPPRSSSGASPPRTTRRGSTACRTASTTGSTGPTA